MMRTVFKNEISIEDCQQALSETKWNVPMAIKYVKLKQLLSAQLGDITLCKEALMACDWDVQRAANHILSNLSSPEIIDVQLQNVLQSIFRLLGNVLSIYRLEMTGSDESMQVVL